MNHNEPQPTSYKQKIARIRRNLWILLSLPMFLGFSCEPKIKHLGQGNILPNPSTNPSSSNSMVLSFAVRTLTTDTALSFQGTANSAGAIAAICGSTGSNCVCDFFTDSSGSGKVSSASGSTTYFSTGNFLNCSIPGSSTPSTFTYARVRDLSNLRFSNTIPITNQDDADTTKRLTLLKILGDLPANQTRKIFEYRCYHNYLEKAGTTLISFDCTAGALGIVQVPYYFYLFADNITNNFSNRFPDVLHNDGSGSLCGSLIKFLDCTTDQDGALNPNGLTLSFGLYAQQTGPFSVAVQLTSAPARMQGVNSTYGFAAPYDSTNNVCPPGFEKMQYFKATPAAVANSNLNSTLVDTRVANFTTVTQMLVDEFTVGGSCNGTTCTPPSIDRDVVVPASNLQTITYTAQSAATTDRFCVLPTTLLGGI